MSVVWSRLFKSAYRKEPISGFIIIVGAVDTMIGGVSDRWSLTAVGLGLVGVAIGFRWLSLRQHNRADLPMQSPVRYLPDRSSRPQLPTLNSSHQQPPK